MQRLLCFVNNSLGSNQDKSWTCLCDLSYLEHAQPSNYTASNKQCCGCEKRMLGVGDRPELKRPPLEVPISLELFFGYCHTCWDSPVILYISKLYVSLQLGRWLSSDLPISRSGKCSCIVIIVIVWTMQYTHVVNEYFMFMTTNTWRGNCLFFFSLTQLC